MNRKIVVIAGHHGEYLDWLQHVPEEQRGRYVEADRPSKLFGIHIESILEIGTSYNRKDYSEIRAEARARIIPALTKSK